MHVSFSSPSCQQQELPTPNNTLKSIQIKSTYEVNARSYTVHKNIKSFLYRKVKYERYKRGIGKDKRKATKPQAP